MSNDPPINIASTLRNERYCRALFCYLRDKQQERHLEFWLEAEEFKKLNTTDQKIRSTEIIAKYFTNKTSPHLLNMEANEILEEGKDKPELNKSFETAQHSSELYLSSFYEGFTTSKIYKKLKPALKDSMRKSKRSTPKKIKIGDSRIDKLIKNATSSKHKRTRSKNLKNSTPQSDVARSQSIPITTKIIPTITVSRSIQEMIKTLSDSQVKELYTLYTSVLFNKNFLFLDIIMKNAIPTQDCGDVCQALVDIFIYNDSVSNLLSHLFKNDITNFKGTDNSVLFRTDSPATMTMSKYVNRVGKSFLSSTLLPVIASIEQNHPNGIEIDPNVGGADLDVEKNVGKLIELVDNILERIKLFIEQCPKTLKKDLLMIYQLVEKNIPNTGQQVLGSILFLRFICPAIVSPTRYQLIKNEPNKQTARSLILISKLLTNLVNGVDNAKEQFMRVANSFLCQNNRDKLENFMKNLIKDVNLGTNIDNDEYSELAAEALQTLQTFTAENFQEIWNDIIQHEKLAISFSPFFKVGLMPIKTYLPSNSLGHT